MGADAPEVRVSGRGSSLPERAARFGPRVAVVHEGRSWRYSELIGAAHSMAESIENTVAPTAGRRVACLARPGPEYVAAMWAAWRSGSSFVPLAVTHPPPELRAVLDDADPWVAIVDPELANLLRRADAAIAHVPARADASASALGATPSLYAAGGPALMIYTSGTTGRPKGVVTSHSALAAQVDAQIEAWEWSSDDWLLNVLPLHHVHGVVNALCVPLAVGARCEFLGFEPAAVWERLSSGDVTVFMAVPTIYRRLLAEWEAAAPDTRQRWSRGVETLRLMVSGSAALPVPVLERWRRVTGHTLLERYGMTEIGMGLTNPYRGERRPGTVGQPFPGVEVRIVDSRGRQVPDGEAGEIEVRGPQLFTEYWRAPDATAEVFRDGWFRTGDEAVREDGYVRILGRRSVDILKSGGYKLSALEIEAALLEHPSVRECAVVGVADPEWGQCVCAAVVPEPTGSAGAPTLEELRSWARERLAPYKIPRRLLAVESLPRNAMGKIMKDRVAALFEAQP